MTNRPKFKVKLTFPFDKLLLRQTPNWSGVWGDYEFILNEHITECDFWVIFSAYALKKETCYCPPQNVIFMPGETYSIEQFDKGFLKQFALIVTCQREIEHRNVSYNLGAHPWFVGKTYDELLALNPVKKSKKISIVTSNKTMNDGHKKRLEFALKLKEHFKDEIDLYGRGINDFDDKWDVLTAYKYSVAIENDNCDDWLTEKFYDCHLAFTYPFYYGCPNAEEYFVPQSFTRINIDDFDESVSIIQAILNDDTHYENHLQYIQSERLKLLKEYNLFPLLVSYFEKMDGKARRKKVTIKPYQPKRSLKRFLKRNMQNIFGNN